MFKFSEVSAKTLAGFFGILLISFAPSFSFASQNEDEQMEALKSVMTASYKQLGIEENINKYIESLIAIEYKKYVQHVVPIVETVTKRKLELKWEF